MESLKESLPSFRFGGLFKDNIISRVADGWW